MPDATPAALAAAQAAVPDTSPPGLALALREVFIKGWAASRDQIDRGTLRGVVQVALGQQVYTQDFDADAVDAVADAVLGWLGGSSPAAIRTVTHRRGRTHLDTGERDGDVLFSGRPSAKARCGMWVHAVEEITWFRAAPEDQCTRCARLTKEQYR